MTIDYNKCLEVARKQALAAKPGFIKENGKTYTFVFDENEGHYQVYEDMVWLVNFNTKVLSTAKKFLREWLVS